MLNVHSGHSDSFLHFINYVEFGGASPQFKNSTVNWVEKLDQANKLGVGSILYYRMKQKAELLKVPKAIMDQCKTRLYWDQARNMKRFGRLQEVLRAFSRNEIPVVVLKGAALANLVYSHMGLRPMADVDLLVQEKDLLQVEQLLVSFGFQANEHSHSKEWYRKNHHHVVPYFSPDGSLVIEVHRRLICLDAPVDIPNHELWERSCPADITKTSCRVLSPEDLLIHLSLHLAVDAYIGKLRVMYDLAETIEVYQQEIAWDILLDLAQGYQISKYLYYAFEMAKETVNADVPARVLDALKLQFSGLPFEDQLIKAGFRKVLVLHDQRTHQWCRWMIQMGCLDILSAQSKLEKLQKIIGRVIGRYKEFSVKHARQMGVSPTRYLLVGYPMYLLRKALGLSTSQTVTHTK